MDGYLVEVRYPTLKADWHYDGVCGYGVRRCVWATPVEAAEQVSDWRKRDAGMDFAPTDYRVVAVVFSPGANGPRYTVTKVVAEYLDDQHDGNND